MSSEPAPAGIGSIIDALLALVRDRVPAEQVETVSSFAREYYAGASSDDLGRRATVDLYGAALAHWSFARQRRPGDPKVRVYNPQPQQHGWQSTHTIVEMVTDDMPFLVDSVRMALNRRGLTTHLVIHPVMRVCRDPAGTLLAVVAQGAHNDAAITEAVMHLEVDRQTEPALLDELRTDVEAAFRDVRVTIEDWRAMQERLKEILAEITSRPPPLDVAELVQAQAFLEWISDDHFTFLGYRDYELIEENGDDALRSIAGSGLGLLRNPHEARVSATFASLPAHTRRLAREPRLLIVTKANARSPVHRPGYMDYVGIKTLRRRRGRGRAPVPRPVHLGCLQSHPARDSSAAREGRARDGARHLSSK